jgi:hypothetical protein
MEEVHILYFANFNELDARVCQPLSDRQQDKPEDFNSGFLTMIFQ